MILSGNIQSRKRIGIIAGAFVLLIAGWFWWQAVDKTTAGIDSPTTQPANPPHKQRPATGKDAESGRSAGIARIEGRSENHHVRALADKLAKEFERDPSILAKRLADEDNKHLASSIGRDLIVMFPDKTEELMAGFKATHPPELASSLCGRLVKSVAARGRSDEALALADTLEPGRNRVIAFTDLASSLQPEDFGRILEKVRADGFPDDARRIESGLSSRAQSFPAKNLESLMAMHLGPDASQAVRAAYGARLVSENGRAAAFQTALSLPPDRQPDALYGVLNRGATQEEGAKWLLESLALVPPGVPLDRSNLTLGVAQQMLERSGSSAMAWALAIPDPPLRDATAAGVMNSWLVMDSMEASAWLGKQPAGSIKDAAICEVAKFLAAHGDLAAARGWLAEMHNSAKKGALEKDIQVLAEGAPR